MVVAGAAIMRIAHGLPGVNLDCAFRMVVARDARERIVRRVETAFLVFASLMEVVDDTWIPTVRKEPKEAPWFAKLMVGETAALFLVVTRVPKEAPLSTRAMGEGGVAHGGKRSAVPECTKSDRGRTDFCLRHGGGKRCVFEGCGKSAQGSTDFCKAHGGGKRRSQGHPGSEFGNRECPCNSFARGKSGLCTSHGALVQDKRVHCGATIITTQSRKMTHMFTAEDTSFDLTKMENSMIRDSPWQLESSTSPANFSTGWRQSITK